MGSGVRPFAVQDIPQVADLWWTILRHRKGSPPPALLSYFEELYFTSPLVDSTMPSLVYEDKTGRIVGFLGVVRRRMTLRGQPIRVAFGGNFVMKPEARSSLGGLRLLADYMAGSQDLSQTDSANDISKNLLERLGFRAIVPLSIHWARPLRPAHYAVQGISKLSGPLVSGSLKIATKPFCSLVDSLASRLSSSPFRQSVPRLHAGELDVETLVQCLKEYRWPCSIEPEIDSDSLKWLLSFMERTHPHASLRKVLLRDNKQNIVGWYIYYLKPGAIGHVVQVGGQRQFTKDILEHLFHDAWSRGVVGVHGVVPVHLMGEFSEKNCIFTCRGGWNVVHSRNPELLELLTRGDAHLSRLDGEWCLNFDE
jgi:hypothetical protein